jgi:hypothetical protein
VGRKIVQNDPDHIGLRVMEVDEIAHAFGKVLCGALFRDLDPPPGPMRIEKDKKIDRSVASIFAIIAFRLARLGRNRLARLADKLMGALVKTHDGSLWVMPFGIKIEDVFHPGDISAIDMGNTPHVFAPGLEIVLGPAPAYGLA